MPHDGTGRPPARPRVTGGLAGETSGGFPVRSGVVVNLPGVPFPLEPVPADAWRVGTSSVTVIAPPRSDIFVDPGDTPESTLNAATLLGVAPDGDFQLSARVTVDFATT